MSRAEDAEAIRLRHVYRRAVLAGRSGTPLPRRAAVRLVGPDCAYHLYPGFQPAAGAPEEAPDAPRGDPAPGVRPDGGARGAARP